MNLASTLIIGTAFLYSGCSSVTNYSQLKHIPSDGKITVLPFQNNTNTPMAGKKAKNIMEGVLASKHHSVNISAPNTLCTINSINTRYYVSGTINEWRYKTGIEAEPAVAMNFNVIDKLNGNIVYSAVGAKNGWGQESIGSIAQKLILELTNNE